MTRIPALITIAILGVTGFTGALWADDASDLDSYERELSSWEEKLKKSIERSRELNDSVKEMLKHNQEALEDLIDEMCALDVEQRGDDAYDKAEDMVEEVQRRAEGRYREIVDDAEDLKEDVDYIVDQLDDLVDDIDDLTDSEQVGDDAEKLIGRANQAWDLSKKTFSELDKREDQITRAATGVLRGANDPLIAARMKHGIEMHKEMQSDFDCDEKEYSAGGGYADCISFEKCTVWEFKPSGYSDSSARSQLERYLPDIRDDFKDHSEVKENCEFDSNGLPKFKALMATYPRCTP